MRMYPREFPATRRKKLKRRAERRIYKALAGSDCQGFVYYEWRKKAHLGAPKAITATPHKLARTIPPCCATARTTWMLARNTTNGRISSGRCTRPSVGRRNWVTNRYQCPMTMLGPVNIQVEQKARDPSDCRDLSISGTVGPGQYLSLSCRRATGRMRW